MGTTLDGLLTFSELYKRQSNFLADALRVLMVGFDGVNYNVVNIDSSGAISTSGGGSEVATAADGGAAPALYKVIAGVDPDTSLVQSIATSSVGVLRVADCSASGNFSAHGTHADGLLTTERGFVQKSVLYGYNGTDIDLIRTSEAGTSLTKGILATALYYFDSVGGNWDRIPKGQQTGAESLPVVLASDTALPAGTNAIGKLAANSGVDIGDVDVLTIPGIAGTVAHDGADSGNPVKVGYKAIAHGSNPTAVAASDRTDAYSNRHGIPWVIGGHPNIITCEYNTTAAQTDDAIIDSIGAGTKIVVTQIDATLGNATSVTVGVRIGFGSSTLTAEGSSGAPAVNGIVLSHSGLAAGSGIVKGNGSGIIGIGGDGEELRITNDVPTTGKLRVTVTYYTIES